MSKFIAVHTLPLNKEQFMQTLTQGHGAIPNELAWKQTYCDFGSQKFFCDWEAPSKEALEEYFKVAKMPYEAIYSVEIFNVAAKTFEK
jgi:hypothetical protein